MVFVWIFECLATSWRSVNFLSHTWHSCCFSAWMRICFVNVHYIHRTCRRLSSTTSETLAPENGQDKQLHPMSVQTRRKTVHHHRVEPRGACTTSSPTESPRSEQIQQQHRHLEVANCAGNGNGATPSPQKRANNRQVPFDLSKEKERTICQQF